MVQVTALPEYLQAYSIVNRLRVEQVEKNWPTVVAVEGVVRLRPTEAINEDWGYRGVRDGSKHLNLRKE
uniref:Uncharacterized protein n=1 Tax=Triticum urartu TaxID=4572 RepID=A0A8R7UTW7_TRIUA